MSLRFEDWGDHMANVEIRREVTMSGPDSTFRAGIPHLGDGVYGARSETIPGALRLLAEELERWALKAFYPNSENTDQEDVSHD